MFAAICVAMSYAGGELINNVFGFGKLPSIIVATSIVTAYSCFGGIRATIQTDAFQFIHFVVLIPLLAVIMVLSSEFSATHFTATLTQSTQSSFETLSISSIVGMALVWAFISGVDTNGIVRTFSARSDRAIRMGMIFAGLFLAGWLLLMNVIGVMGKSLRPDMRNSDQILLSLAEIHFPDAIYGIFIIAMIGVIMSSQDSLLNGASVVFCEDIIDPFFKMTDEGKVICAKAATIGSGIVSIVIAGGIDSVISFLMPITEFYVPMLLPLIPISVLLKRYHWQSAAVAMGTGTFSFVLWKNSAMDEFLPAILVALILNLASYAAVHLWLSRPRETHLAEN